MLVQIHNPCPLGAQRLGVIRAWHRAKRGGQLILAGREYCWSGGARPKTAVLPNNQLPREHVVTSSRPTSPEGASGRNRPLGHTAFPMASQEKVGMRDVYGQQRGGEDSERDGNRKRRSGCLGCCETGFHMMAQSQENEGISVRSGCEAQSQVSRDQS